MQVAEGKAHLYPRLAPTSEWDTCASHIIVLEAGGIVLQAGNCDNVGKPLENWKVSSIVLVATICHSFIIAQGTGKLPIQGRIGMPNALLRTGETYKDLARESIRAKRGELFVASFDKR